MLSVVFMLCGAIALGASAPVPASAGESVSKGDYQREVLMRSSSSWDGGDFHYPGGAPEISAMRLTLPNGGSTSMHCHPVPTFGYMIRGKLRVDTADGKSTLLESGDALIEVMNTWHSSEVVEGPVEILAFYAGAVGLENTVLKSSGGSCE